MIDAQNLRKVYRINVKKSGLKGVFENLIHAEWTEKVAVDDLSFRMKEGRALACIGENGAGKSTLIKMMIGILTPTAGTVRVFGEEPRRAGRGYLRRIGLDINVKHTIRTFLRQMNQETGTGIFLTSHDLDDIDEICDDAIVLSGGRLIYDGTLEQLKHRFAQDKMIQVVGRQEGDICRRLPMAKIGTEGRVTKIVYPVREYSSAEALAAVSDCFAIEDITIQEPDIDEVVSRIFAGEEAG